MPILLDFSQVAIASLIPFRKDLEKDKLSPEATNIIRHSILSTIKAIKKKFKNEFGELVLACDGRQYWRKTLFPYYKASRAKLRDKSDMDWTFVFDTISKIRDDIESNFPYKVVHLDTVEGDDIIGVLCKWYQTNELIDHGIFETPQPILIVSSDTDYIQLHRYKTVKQWSPIHDRFVKAEGNPNDRLYEKIARGDVGDGIPNVLSDDAVLITEGVRQKKMMAPRVAAFIENGRDECKNDTERRNWDRNNSLINLDLIPQAIANTIVDRYINITPTSTKMDIYNYLVKHRCRLLIDDIENF